MTLRWSDSFPHWLGRVITIFGLANVAGGVASLETILPGVVIGGFFAVIGLKRGFPLFPTSPPVSMSERDRLAEGLRVIRRRRILLLLSCAAWLPIAVVSLSTTPERYLPTVLFLGALVPGALSMLLTYSECPRCRQFFLLPRNGIGFARLYLQCRNCG